MRSSILFLTNAYPDFNSSTRGIFIRKMASLLQNEGYRISVVTPKIFRKSPCYEEQNGIHVYRFPFFAGNKLLIEYRRIPYLKMVLYFISGFFLTMYVSLRHKCSLLHVHWAIPTGLIAVVAGMVLRKPFVVTVHGSDFRMASEGAALLKRIFLFVCQRASHLNCVSEVMRKEIIRIGIDGEKVSTFPMGIDNAFFETGKSRGRKLNGGPYIIVSNRQLTLFTTFLRLSAAILSSSRKSRR